MNIKQIQIPEQLFRTATVALQKRDDGEEDMCMSISSDEPYKRYDWMNDEWYYEVLDHSPGGCDDTRLKAGLPILFNHDRNQHLGRATSFKNDGKKITVSGIKWSESEFAQTKKKDALSGALPDTSVGYRITDDGECIGAKDGIPIYKFKWAIHEASLVTIPADTTVGVGRGEKPEGLVCRNVDQKGFDTKPIKSNSTTAPTNFMPPEPTTQTQEQKPTVDVIKERAGAVAEYKSRCDKIRGFVAGLKNEQWRKAASAIADKHIANDEPDFDTFRTEALNSFEGVTQAVETPQIGMNKKEKESFSLMRAIRTLANKQPLDGLEKEVSDAAAKKSRVAQRPDAIYLPEDITGYDLREHPDFNVRAFGDYVRAQNVTTATAGGFTVATMLGSLIELLRNKTVLGQAGITTIGGLVGDLAFPVQTGGATAYWVSETGSLTDSQATFAQKSMLPHRLGATIPFTTQFLAQSSLSAEQFVRNELMIVSGLALDLAGLEGTGVAGQPLGVKNTTGINATVTFGGSAVWADVVEFETGITTDNADIGSMAFILSSATVGKWKTILKDSVAGADYLITSLNGNANGYPVLRTNQVTGNIAFFGVWSQLIHAMWATQEIIVDPYALKKSGGIEVTMNSFHDYLVRQPLAFNVSTDSAAQ